MFRALLGHILRAVCFVASLSVSSLALFAQPNLSPSLVMLFRLMDASAMLSLGWHLLKHSLSATVRCYHDVSRAIFWEIKFSADLFRREPRYDGR